MVLELNHGKLREFYLKNICFPKRLMSQPVAPIELAKSAFENSFRNLFEVAESVCSVGA